MTLFLLQNTTFHFLKNVSKQTTLDLSDYLCMDILKSSVVFHTRKGHIQVLNNMKMNK